MSLRLVLGSFDERVLAGMVVPTGLLSVLVDVLNASVNMLLLAPSVLLVLPDVRKFWPSVLHCAVELPITTPLEPTLTMIPDMVEAEPPTVNVVEPITRALPCVAV